MAFSVEWLADNWDALLAKEKQASTLLRTRIVAANKRLAYILTLPLPEQISIPIRRSVAALHAPLEPLFELMDAMPRIPGNPPRLAVTAGAWIREILTNTSNLPIDPTNDLKATPDGTPGQRWTGDAANQYVTVATAQKEPLSALNEVYPKLNQALRDLAFQNAILLPVITVAFVGAAGGIATAALGLEGGPIGWAVAAVAVAEVIIALFGFVGAVVAALISYQMTIAPHINELQVFLADNSKFGVERNPDGSVRDVTWPNTPVDLPPRVLAEDGQPL